MKEGLEERKRKVPEKQKGRSKKVGKGTKKDGDIETEDSKTNKENIEEEEEEEPISQKRVLKRIKDTQSSKEYSQRSKRRVEVISSGPIIREKREKTAANKVNLKIIAI